MFGSAMLFLDWRFSFLNSLMKSKSTIKEQEEETTTTTITVEISQDTLAQHLTNPLFVVVTLFLSCLLLTISFLPVIWFPWIMHLTGNDIDRSK